MGSGSHQSSTTLSENGLDVDKDLASLKGEERAADDPDHAIEQGTATLPRDEENIPNTKVETQAEDPYLVKWDKDDPANPRNWPTGQKSFITFVLGILALSASLPSSIISPAQNTISEEFNVSSEATVLSISLYILGFAFGPLIWAPISEIWGRRYGIFPAIFCLGLFSIGTATSQNAQSIFITRFFGGLCGSAPVSNVSAALGDIWNPNARGIAVIYYSMAVVGGPTLGPTIGASIAVKLGWRWTEYVAAIFSYSIFIVAFFGVPELYAPVLLKRKAIRLRKETGNQAYYHPHETLKLDFKSLVTKQFSRPMAMLFTEPMVTAIAFYASFVYALLYMTIEVFPIVFAENRGLGEVDSTYPFLALFVGVVLSMLINLANQPRYIRKSREANGKPVPEARLPPMAIGGILFAIGLFWFGWTAAPEYHIALPCLAAGFIGAGFNVLFQQCINFLVDTYGPYAASATAANTFLRSVLAAGFPLLAKPMFHNLGVGPAMSIVSAVATILIPVPFIFMKYGVALRKKSRFAPFQG